MVIQNNGEVYVDPEKVSRSKEHHS